jgi:tetratricopeptide (TPR) repeat protein
MNYNVRQPVANFEQAHRYAIELESVAAGEPAIIFELAQFYTEWSTAIKMKMEHDPLREGRRQQDYKEHADKAILLLKRIPENNTAEYYYLLAQTHYNKWDYNPALGFINRAIDLLPDTSYLAGHIGDFAQRFSKSELASQIMADDALYIRLVLSAARGRPWALFSVYARPRDRLR